MNYDRIGLEPPLRVMSDREDWPASGLGWVRVPVPMGTDVTGVDCAVVSVEGPVAALAMSGALRGVPIVVAPLVDTPLGLIDAASGVVFVDDAPETIAHVLRQACLVDVPGVRERRGEVALISALSQEAARIADALARMAEQSVEGRDVQAERIDAALVRRIIKLRRDRERHFPAEIFADPAWDMLLDLMAARLEGQRLSVSSLCIGAAVPTTTALRWIRSLAEAGIFERGADPVDARRTWIGLSDTAHGAMMAWLGRFVGVFSVA